MFHIFGEICIIGVVLDDLVDNQLYLGFPEIFNTTRADCVWRDPLKDRMRCSEEVNIWLYSGGYEELVGFYTLCRYSLNTAISLACYMNMFYFDRYIFIHVVL